MLVSRHCGYYQPAGPLISAAAASHHLAPPPHVGGGSKAQQQHAALPPTPTPPPTSQTGQSSAPSTRDESSDNDVTIIATGTSSEVMPQYRYPSQQPQQYGYGYPHTPQYYPSPPASSLQYPPHYHSHQDLCYPPPPYFHHKSYSTPPPPPPPAAARYHQRYLPQYYEAPPPPPPPQQQSGTSTQQMVSTSSSGSGGTGYQAVGPPAPTSSDSYGPPPPPIVEPYPPPPGYYGYGAAPGTPACYSHSPPTRSLAYIDAAYQSCPCPMQSCPKNVHTGPLTGDGKGPAPNSTSKASSLPPIALALPLEIPGGALGPPSPARGSAGMPPPPSPATAWGPDQQQQALMATASATQLMCSEDGRVSNDHVHKSNFSVNDVSSEKCSEEISSRHQQEGQTNITLVDPKLETSPLVKQESRITIISEETVKPSEVRNDKPSSPLSRKRRLSSGGGKVEITEPVVAKKPRDENVTPAAQPSTPKVLEAVQQEKSFPEQESSKQLPVKEEHLSKINGVQQGAKQSLKKKKCKTEKIKQTIVKKRQTQPKIYPSRTKLLCINNNKVTGPQAIDNILLENRACQKQLKDKLNKTSTPRSVGRPKSKQQVKTEVAKKKIVNRRLSTSKQNTMESAGKKVSNSNSALVLHRKMTIPKRLTNTLKWSNGWSWEGTPFEAKVFLTSDDVPVMRTCYPAMRHVEGDLVCPHDSVLLKSGPRKLDLPFVAKVAALWENPDDGEMMVSLLWYYRPEHTEQGCIAADAEDEIFASKHKDINSVACIEDKCYVLTFNEYCRYRKAARRQDEGVPEPPRVVPLPEDNPRRHFQPPGCVSSDLVFYCRRVYDFRQKRIVSSRVQGCRYGRTLGRHRARRLL